MLSLTDERPPPKSSEDTFKVFQPSLKFKDAQKETPPVQICIQSSTKPILMKISAVFECLPGLSEAVWGVKKHTMDQKNGDHTKDRSGGL